MELAFIVLRCQNIYKSKDFYQRLGLNFTEEKHGSGPLHFSCRIQNTVLELYPNSGNSNADPMRIGLAIDNLEEQIRHFDAVQTRQLNHQRFYVIEDPDGRKIELHNTALNIPT